MDLSFNRLGSHPCVMLYVITNIKKAIIYIYIYIYYYFLLEYPSLRLLTLDQGTKKEVLVKTPLV